MDKKIIGRKEEQEILKDLLQDNKPHLLAVYGRRRVGKTYLVKTFFDKQILFECSGAVDATTHVQLINFSVQLHKYFGSNKNNVPATWQKAFHKLNECMSRKKSKQKKVLFFDELPWLDTHKSGFLSAFSYWWNMHGSQRNDLLVIICGSSASWMINKIVKHRGGLHNRITKRIRLLPFTLKETEAYLQYRHIRLTHYQITQLYMVLGGVPHYLNALKAGDSVAQNINKICFGKDGLLTSEFDNLYRSLFTNSDKHLRVVRLLSNKNKGLTRNEMVQSVKEINSGGGISKVLDELTESGFIEKSIPFKKKVKDAVYRLSDEFTAFYLKFMEGITKGNEGWQHITASNNFKIWSGYAFEGICLKHIKYIKKKLGISGVYTEQGSWRLAGNKKNKGTQIDLLIDRNDGCINLCEIKFYNNEFEITKAYSAIIENKKLAFQTNTQTQKSVFTTMITTFGVINNAYKTQCIDSLITADDLFR